MNGRRNVEIRKAAKEHFEKRGFEAIEDAVEFARSNGVINTREEQKLFVACYFRACERPVDYIRRTTTERVRTPRGFKPGRNKWQDENWRAAQSAF